MITLLALPLLSALGLVRLVWELSLWLVVAVILPLVVWLIRLALGVLRLLLAVVIERVTFLWGRPLSLVLGGVFACAVAAAYLFALGLGVVQAIPQSGNVGLLFAVALISAVLGAVVLLPTLPRSPRPEGSPLGFTDFQLDGDD